MSSVMLFLALAAKGAFGAYRVSRAEAVRERAAARNLEAAALPDPTCRTGVLSLKASGKAQVCCAGYCGECSDYPTCDFVRGQNSSYACCKTKVYERKCGAAPANVCIESCSKSLPPCIMDAKETFKLPDPDAWTAGSSCNEVVNDWRLKAAAAMATTTPQPPTTATTLVVTTITTSTTVEPTPSSPSTCTSSRGCCNAAIDDNTATWCWMTSSGTCGEAPLDFKRSSPGPICGVAIQTTSALGTEGSNTCLKVAFEVDGSPVSSVSATRGGGTPLTLSPGGGYDANNYHPKGQHDFFSWDCQPGAGLKIRFANCDGGCYTHWPMSEVKLIG